MGLFLVKTPAVPTCFALFCVPRNQGSLEHFAIIFFDAFFLALLFPVFPPLLVRVLWFSSTQVFPVFPQL